MKTFKDLEPRKHPNHPDGTQAKMFFDNGYGVSVIKSTWSYGGDEGFYELAILKGLENAYDIAYDTPLADDVFGYLTEEEVSAHMIDVQNLDIAND